MGFKHPPDFEVKYKFLSIEEGGKTSQLVLQGYRCDWSYKDDDISKTGIYMIWPEFEDIHGGIIPSGSPVLPQGIAKMHIINQELKEQVHRSRLKVGVKGFMMEGKQKVAEAEIISITR